MIYCSNYTIRVYFFDTVFYFLRVLCAHREPVFNYVPEKREYRNISHRQKDNSRRTPSTVVIFLSLFLSVSLASHLPLFYSIDFILCKVSYFRAYTEN